MRQSLGSDRRVPVLVVAVLFMAGAAVLAFLIVRVWDDNREPGIVIVDPQAASTIVVSVEGAVASPGAYDLPGVSRVRDAIEVAGGPTDDADLREVNLARRLRDEERLVIPREGDERPLPVVSEIPATPEGGTPVLDLNEASAAELETLPEIGPALADRIVAFRAENGPFQTVEELEEVQGISARMVEELRPFVTVGT